jgi:hypothetical protein
MRTIVVITCAVAVIGGAWYLLLGGNHYAVESENSNVIRNTFETASGLGFRFATSTFTVATTFESIAIKRYTPPCASDFDYCIYRVGTEYEGTNFESAGLRIKERSTLVDMTSCLSTPPQGFASLSPRKRAGQGYSTAVFSPLADAGAGHYTEGALYRLFYGATCYEFEVRIGESQFANYPKGTVREFERADRDLVSAELANILNSIVVDRDTVPIIFPSLD